MSRYRLAVVPSAFDDEDPCMAQNASHPAPTAARTAGPTSDPWRLDLAGEWACVLDPASAGERAQWPERELADATPVHLPGSVQHQGLGDAVALDTPWTGGIVDRSFFDDERYARYREPGNVSVPFWLQPSVYYRGLAWFQREIVIPLAWAGRRVQLDLERVHWASTEWLDGERLGGERSLTTPHQVSLGRLTPGRHLLTLAVANSTIVDVGPNSHAISDHTQGNWNGVVGELALTALPETTIDRVRLFADIAARTVEVRLDVAGGTWGVGAGTVRASVRRVLSPDGDTDGDRDGDGDGVAPVLDVATAELAGEVVRDRSERGVTATGDHIDLTLRLGDDAPLWDEFSPALHEVTVELETLVQGVVQRHTVTQRFGLREIAVDGGRFTINGRPAFFRGTLECAAFPLTGYPPTDVGYWRGVIETCRAHGLNLLRFHSWCPPEAAFVAADEAGFYLHVEGPLWANQAAAVGRGGPVDAFLLEETRRILDTFGNHPSFVMMAHGNEPAGRDAEFLGSWLRWCQRYDPRRLYTSAAGWPAITESDFDSIPDPRTHQWGEGLESRLNGRAPETETDYRDWVAATPRPVISHEIGQWCAYPDFSEIERYTGLMQPANLRIFRDFLAEAGLGEYAEAFLHASGRLQTLCYQEEVEAALRTEGFGGFHLLGLNDFPGQGTALVGVINAFWESKGYVTAQEYSRFCGPTIPLARLPRRVWTSGDDVQLEVQIAHFGAAPLHGDVTWTLRDEAGEVVTSGLVAADAEIALGNGTRFGPLRLPSGTGAGSTAVAVAAELTLWIGVHDGAASDDGASLVNENSWPLWFLPPAGVAASSGAAASSSGVAASGVAASSSELVVTTDLEEAVRSAERGERVLLELASGVDAGDASPIGNDVALGFTPVFWNTAWTEGQAPHTLGTLHDPAHPLFRHFPTRGHTDWQWWDLLHGSRAMLVDGLPAGLEPIVRPIDTWFEARPLGALLEVRLGAGRIAVSSLNLAPGADRPAATYFRECLVAYLGSAEFNPSVAVTAAELRSVLR